MLIFQVQARFSFYLLRDYPKEEGKILLGWPWIFGLWVLSCMSSLQAKTLLMARLKKKFWSPFAKVTLRSSKSLKKP